MLKIKFKKTASSVKLPIKGSTHAACWDVYANSITFQNNKMIIGLGFATEIPEGYKGIIIPRSNLVKHHWVLNNSMGVIDSDYRGEWKIFLTPLEGHLIDNALPYGVGDRCAQIYFEKVLDIEFKEVTELSTSGRGEGGFGSTGV